MSAGHSVGRPGRQLADGTIRLLLADGLAVPAGLLLAAYLTRRLGPAGYGHFVVAATITASLEWTLVTIFSRATIKIVSDSGAGSRAAEAVLRVQLVSSLAVAAAVWVVAGVAAEALDLPPVARSLRLFALDIPLFTMAWAHWQVGVGLGRFRPRATGSAARWLTRIALAVIFVESGFSSDGAIAACVGASVVELAIARRYFQPRLSGAVGPLWRAFPPFMAPLIMYALSMRLLDKVDLLMLGALGAGLTGVGVYGAAQGLALLPGLVAQSLAPLTLATVNQLLRAGREQEARDVARQALRAVLWLVPVAAMVAGASDDLVVLVFGERYHAAAGPLAWLIVGAAGQAAIAVASMILTARERARLVWAIGGVLCPVAVAGHFIAIPARGADGAAIVTMAVSVAGACAMWTALAVTWDLRPPAASVCRAALASGLAYALAVSRAGGASSLPVDLILIGSVVIVAQLAMGEFSVSDVAELRWLTGRRPEAEGSGT